ncbi:reverse transcriptase domain-containing protein [Tanacetum coccineum]
MIQYLEKVKGLITGFKKFSIEQVSGSENKKSDALSKITSTSFTHLTKQVLVEVLKEKSIDEKEIFVVAEYVVREIHKGSCSLHSGPRSVAAKAIRSGYYWPTMHKDTRSIIQKCDNCQVHHRYPETPNRSSHQSPPHGHSTNGELTSQAYSQKLMEKSNS